MKALNWWDRQSPLTGIAIVLGTFLVAALIAAVGRVPETQPTSFIMILTTPAPTMPMPTADLTLAAENAALRARVAELEAERSRPDIVRPASEPQPVYHQMSVQTQPTAGYTAHTTQGEVFIPNDATPVPNGVPYDGPFLVPETTPLAGPRLCEGFGDWRDFDPAYASSPACHT